METLEHWNITYKIVDENDKKGFALLSMCSLKELIIQNENTLRARITEQEARIVELLIL